MNQQKNKLISANSSVGPLTGLFSGSGVNSYGPAHQMHSQHLFSNNSGSLAAAAAALLQNHHSGGSYVSLPPHPHNHELLIQHMQRAAVAAAAAASHVAATHRRRKARTVFSDQQLHGLERRLFSSKYN